MNSYDKRSLLMIAMFTGLATLNFFVVITGAADGLYGSITEWLQPILLLR